MTVDEELARARARIEELEREVSWLRRWKMWRSQLDQVRYRAQPGEVDRWLDGHPEPQPE